MQMSVTNIYFQTVKEYTFLDYIMGGCQINFTVSATIYESLQKRQKISLIFPFFVM